MAGPPSARMEWRRVRAWRMRRSGGGARPSPVVADGELGRPRPRSPRTCRPGCGPWAAPPGRAAREWGSGLGLRAAGLGCPPPLMALSATPPRATPLGPAPCPSQSTSVPSPRWPPGRVPRLSHLPGRAREACVRDEASPSRHCPPCPQPHTPSRKVRKFPACLCGRVIQTWGS